MWQYQMLKRLDKSKLRVLGYQLFCHCAQGKRFSMRSKTSDTNEINGEYSKGQAQA